MEWMGHLNDSLKDQSNFKSCDLQGRKGKSGRRCSWTALPANLNLWLSAVSYLLEFGSDTFFKRCSVLLQEGGFWIDLTVLKSIRSKKKLSFLIEITYFEIVSDFFKKQPGKAETEWSRFLSPGALAANTNDRRIRGFPHQLSGSAGEVCLRVWFGRTLVY